MGEVIMQTINPNTLQTQSQLKYSSKKCPFDHTIIVTPGKTVTQLNEEKKENKNINNNNDELIKWYQIFQTKP